MSLKLVKEIVKGSVSFFNLSKKEQSAVIYASVSNGDFSALEEITNSFSGIYDYDEHKPYWLKSDFTDFHWKIEIEIGGTLIEKSIPWDTIVLDDEEKLTSTKHLPLLNAFKYWITATDNPLENAGKLNKPATVIRNIHRVISLINGILLRGRSIKLSSNHLQAVSDDFIMTLFTVIAEGAVDNGIYDFQSRVRSFLLTKMVEVSDKEARLFELQHPYVTRRLLEEQKVLGFSQQERVKACCWLERVNFYKMKGSVDTYKRRLTGNNAILFQLLFNNRVIPSVSKFAKLEELMLAGRERYSEYEAMPNADRTGAVSENVLIPFIKVMKLLNVVNSKKSACNLPLRATQRLSLLRVKEHVKLKTVGRFKTLPPQVVFSLIRGCYEFAMSYQEAILDSVLRVLEVGTSKSTEHVQTWVDSKKGSWCERVEWTKEEALAFVGKDLIELGVNRISIINSADDCFTSKRNNEGLFDLYDVLVGSIQILVGVFMARRQDELVTLKPTGNLSPNIDPSSEKGKVTDYQLIFINKKSGNGGQHATSEVLKRPIPRSIALLVWKLEGFNQEAMNAGVNRGKLALFNILYQNQYRLIKVSKDTYNRRLDSACDYFEMPLVKCEGHESRRYYVRQHQLRRFFAMLFFWSKSFDGLDTLRWMLGHTDVEHLYHYISESEAGGVLKGIKASYLVDAMQSQKLENINDLRTAISKRYGVNAVNISLSTLQNAINDYDERDFQTIPSIKSLQEREGLENQILELLERDVITLEPEFFTINKNGQEITDYNLTLQVKELDQG